MTTTTRRSNDAAADAAHPCDDGEPRRIVVVGAGFAGFFAARKLARTLSPGEGQVTIISDTDGMLYQPLLPEVAVGALDPRTVVVPISSALRGVHLIRGHVSEIHTDDRTVTVTAPGQPDRDVDYDHLVLAAGGVTRMFDIDGLAERALGFKTIGEALYLRELVLQRFEHADAEPDALKRSRLLNFVVVGAGYAGTELVAQMSLLSSRLTEVFDNVTDHDVNWTLLDMAPAVMPELGEELGLKALAVLRTRGVDVRVETSISSVDDEAAHLTDGTKIDNAVVVWCAGVAASPLIASTELATTKGRLDVTADLAVPGIDGVFALGDAAAVPDITKDTDDNGNRPICPPTAQHAMRQATTVAANVVADIRGKRRTDYRHKDLGLVVDLGGPDAVARPLGRALSGRFAKVVTRSYHLYALPTGQRRLRVLVDWVITGRQPNDVSFGLLQRSRALAAAEHVERSS